MTNTDKQILTPRQLQILGYIADGYRVDEIAVKLGLKVKTIQMHKCAMYRRMSAVNAPHAVRLAMIAGLI